MNLRMTSFQKLALTTIVAVYVMIVIGVIVRSTGSGLGCGDWPLCRGAIIPALDGPNAWDRADWIESIHRWWGVIVGFLVLGLGVQSWRVHRATRSILLAALVTILLTGFQALLGRWTVETGNSAESVTAHLATSMVILAATIFIFIRSRYRASLPKGGGSQRITLVIAFATASIYVLMLFGSNVTVNAASLVFPDWPLFDGQLLPTWHENPDAALLQMHHFAHRIAAAIVGLIMLWATLVTWRGARDAAADATRSLAANRVFGLVGTAAALYVVQVVVGAFQIWTTLAAWAVSAHLALGGAIWGLMASATLFAWYDARTAAVPATTAGEPIDEVEAAAGPNDGSAAPVARAVPFRDKAKAYVALTKPRIIELLLVTTVPAMVLAWRFVDGVTPSQFTWLVVATLIGGSLAAGAANSINNYIDRDIDLLMVRTQRRPLPAHSIEPHDALLFGLILTVVSFTWLAFTTNLVAAFLALLAIAFYVIVYTLLLKRSTPQNIVIGGAAGALPPMIGWAAVSGDISLPAVFLFLIVFYWTPPHFWALALRIRSDYEAASVPMLPVTHGVRETTHQIALYSVLMVALTLIFFAVAQMGLIFLGGALVLGGLFLFQALAMAREGTDARAVRIYKYSITYLTALFALIIVDVAVFIPLA
jgi:protoheme IX farnesyltransferase